jgi:dienelactone hydrolase
MRFRRRLLAASVVACLLSLALLGTALPVLAEPLPALAPFPASEVQAFYAYDATRPLAPQLTLEEDFPAYQRFHLTYEVEGQKVYATYFRPKRTRTEPGPALVGIHGIWSDRREQFWPIAEAAARNGYAALLPSLPYHHERRTPFSLVSGQQFITRDIPATRANLRRAVVEARRGLDWLLDQPEVDRSRVAVAGVSLGGVIAAVALKVEPRFSAGILAVAAGDLAQNLLYSDIQVVKNLRFWLGIGALSYDQAREGWAIADPALLPGAEEVPVLMLNATDDEIFRVSTVEALYHTFHRADIIWSTSKHRYPEKAAQLQMVEYLNRLYGWHPSLSSAHFTVTERLPSYPQPGDATLPYQAVLAARDGRVLLLEVEAALVDRELGPVVLVDQGLDPTTRAVLRRGGVSLAYVPDAAEPANREAAAEYLRLTSFADLEQLAYARRRMDGNGWEVFALNPDGTLKAAAEAPGRPAPPVVVNELLVHLRSLKGAVPAQVAFVKAIPAERQAPLVQ